MDNVCLFAGEFPMGFGRRQIVLALCSVSTFLVSNGALAQSTAAPPDAGAGAGNTSTCR